MLQMQVVQGVTMDYLSLCVSKMERNEYDRKPT